jgi:hypothetical protein
MKSQSPENSGETYSVTDLPVRQAGLRCTCLSTRQVIPSPEFSGGLPALHRLRVAAMAERGRTGRFNYKFQFAYS